MNEASVSRQEMNLYCNYLLGRDADQQCLSLFERAIRHEETVLDEHELKLLIFVIKNPWCIGLLDSAMGLFDNRHKLRKRMVIAFAILETSPLYFNFFKPRQFGPAYIFRLGLSGIAEVFSGLAGIIILRLF